MAVKIRLQRHGKKNFAFFHIVVADTRAPRDGRYIEQLGSYNPNTNPATIVLNFDRALAWLNVGAQTSLVVRRILSYEGVLLRKHLQGGVAKGALTQEQADQKFNAWKAERDAKIEAKKAGLSKDAAEKAKTAVAAEAKVNAARAEAIAKKKAEAEEAARAAAEAAAAEKAAQEAPSIIFIDEGESVAQNRDDSSNARYDNKTVNQILTLMSNLEKSDDNVFVLMATNKLESLDPAITRDGRFGIIIPIDLPDKEDCKETLELYLRDKKTAPDLNLDELAEKLYGLKVNFATIAGTVERAQRIARRRSGIFDKMRNRTFKAEDMKSVEITQEDLQEALKEVREKEKVKSNGYLECDNCRRIIISD